jgi:XTP/dITP diphosphohydrolase
VSTEPAGPLVLVMASANPDKAVEIGEILRAELGDGLVVEPRPLDVPDVIEDGSTLEDNARLKAVALCEATGRAAVADDTGLEVDALDGAPGVFTARFAGEGATYAENVAHLLAELERVDARDADARRARFHTVALVRFPDGREVVGHGTVEGRIAPAPSGDGGFGYDPVFVPSDGDGRTFAQMSASEKHAVSHRGRAFRSLAGALRH